MRQELPSILVVDDEPFIVLGLKTFLEDEGMEVESAGSGEEALDKVQSGGVFDICIMDQRLPGMNGDATIRALHALCPGLRFIIHTGDTAYTISDELRDMGVGSGHLFRKPLLDMGLLANAVRELVRC